MIGHRYILLLVLVVLGTTLACDLFLKPYTLTVPEMGFCSDWDHESNKPIGVSDVFSQDAQRIYMFAYVKTDEELTYSIMWSYERRFLYRHLIRYKGEGYIAAWIAPEEGQKFQAGVYTVDLVLGKTEVRSASFLVK